MWETWVLTVFSATPSSSAITLVRAPARDQAQHLALARGEVVGLGAARRRRCAISSTTRAATAGESGDVAGVRGADRAHELGRLDVLEQVAGRARAQRGEQLLVVAEAGEHDHARGGRRSRSAPQRADAVEPRHHEVEQDHVGRVLRRGGDRLLAVAGLADHLDVVLQVEERPQALAHDRVVVGDQDADHAAHLQPHARAVAERRARSRASRRARSARSSIEVSPEPPPAHRAPRGVEAARRRRRP